MRGGKMRFFKRFSTLHNSSWSVRPDRWDGICFTPNRDIIVYGMGIFEKHPNGGEFKLDYKYRIKDASGTVIVTS